MEIENFADATEDPVMRCECGGELEQIDSNGVTDPDRMRWEQHQCGSCGDTGTLVMTADGREWAEGCINL